MKRLVVAGAGPVGTCLAIDAALRGVEVVVLDSRPAEAPADAKCNTIAARTMETFRRFGIADQVRALGLPDDHPTDTTYATSLSGPLLCRIPMPSRAERAADGLAPGGDAWYDSHWPSPERMVRASQMYLEPVLRARMLELPEVQFLPGTDLVSFDQDEHGVVVQAHGPDGPVELTGAYLVGCDGGASRVRKEIGTALTGDAEIARTRSTLIRSSQVKQLFGDRRPAWMTWVANHRVRGNVVAINGEDLWLVHRALPEGEQDFEALDADQSLRDVLGVGPEFSYEVLRHEDWVGRRLVADRFRRGRVFLAGDAAHLWVPFAGYGMNAGIADAMNLSWLLSSVLTGWADPRILAAYEAERQPITEQVSQFAMAKLAENAAAMSSARIPALLSWTGGLKGVLGTMARRRLGARLQAMNVPQMVPEGLNFGYYYPDSPIIVPDGEPAPAYDMGTHSPSTVPGCRVPHLSIDRVSVIDRLGPWYTLLRFDPAVPVAALEATGLPLGVVDVPRPESPVFDHALLLVRADAHVVWRGQSLPEDVDALARRLRGAA